MNNRPSLPYTVQLAFAQLANNTEATNKIMSASIGGMTQELLALTHSYAPEDLPLVLAAMKLLSNAMLPVLDDSGRQLMDLILEHTTCITIKDDAFQKEN